MRVEWSSVVFSTALFSFATRVELLFHYTSKLRRYMFVESNEAEKKFGNRDVFLRRNDLPDDPSMDAQYSFDVVRLGFEFFLNGP